MKDSAWYHKLWRNKLGEIPLKKDSASAWSDMNELLNKQLPIDKIPTGKSVYKTSAFVKTALVVATTAIISVLVIVHTNKHHNNLAKNNKHLPAHVIGNNAAGKLSGKDSNSHLKDLTISDSIHHHSDSAVESINQKDTAYSSVITHKSLTANQDPHSLNTNASIVKAKPYQPHNTAEDGIPSNNDLTFKNIRSSKHNSYKSTAKYSGATVDNVRRKNQHLPILKHNAVNNYNSKYNDQQGTSKPDADEKYGIFTDKNNRKNSLTGNTTSGVRKSANLNNDKEVADTKIDPIKIPADKEDIKDAKKTGTKSRVFDTDQKTAKTKESNKKSVNKKAKPSSPIPKYNYGLQLGYSIGHGNSLYAGVFTSYQINPKLLINLGLRFNTYAMLSGDYSHKSYFNPDSVPPFKITDSRKVMALSIPVLLEYKLTKYISLKGGPVIGIPVKQSGISSSLGIVADIRDTVYQTQNIDSTLKKTTINKLNFGFTSGISLQIKHFSIDAMYQVLTPYKINSGLGSYKTANQTFQIGIGYRFK